MLVFAIDWTNVLVALIAGLPAIIAAFYSHGARKHSRSIHGAIETPSGDPIGQVAERAHDLAAVTAMATAGAIEHGSTPPPVTATDRMDSSVERINSDPASPVKVNGGAEGMHS